MKLCLEKNSFFIPPQVERSESRREEFLRQLREELQLDSPQNNSAFKQEHGRNAAPHYSPAQHKPVPKIVSPPLQGKFSGNAAPMHYSPESVPHYSPAQHKSVPKKASPPLQNKFPGNAAPPSRPTSLASGSSVPQRNGPKKVSLNPPIPSAYVVPKQGKALKADSVNKLKESEFPNLQETVRVSKKEAKKMAAKSRLELEQEEKKRCISSPNVDVQARTSSFYQEYEAKLEMGLGILKSPLTEDNYKEKFHHLLCWEEKEHIKQLDKRCNGEYEVKICKKNFIPEGLQSSDEAKYVRYGFIDSKDAKDGRGDTLAYASQASEGSYIILENSSVYAHHVYAKVPFTANYNAIVIAFDAKQYKELTRSKHYSKNDFKFIDRKSVV